ncbi:hypothetical protein H6F76_02950 [Leptolyngbya sp. FACHB-321]|uniref:hypothetical protein n=1 Tax=Leptolyngbya sp. FACHB-321 TaxID=2692807 RepID=UPI0016833FFB|nr:hypothetical protein [Leptolyngbya sp. FACHB-321]MBD2034009.1 hypothetical protein [Leptolyngbya sp. FACHB-321]
MHQLPLLLITGNPAQGANLLPARYSPTRRQERLAYWGLNVEVGIPDKLEPTQHHSLKLRKVQPYYWQQIYGESKE